MTATPAPTPVSAHSPTTAAAPAAWRGRALHAILFDLDGTLLDTAADIALALNRATAEQGWAPVPLDEVRRMIGRGSPILIDRAAAFLGRVVEPAQHARILERFFDHYGALEESGECAARPYAGAADALQALHEAGVRIAVVTNKQHRFATALLHHQGLAGWVDCVVGGDSCARRKPDPEPLLYACTTLGVSAAAALMVGDSTNDVQAARGANIPVFCVPHGYNEGQEPRTLPCDLLLEGLGDLPGLLLHGR